MSKIVINTTPWICLSLLEITDLLPQCYDEIIMPMAVKEEILFPTDNSIGIKEIHSAKWIKFYEIKNKNFVDFFSDLDLGELEVVIAAKELNVKRVMIDETLGRLYAKSQGLIVTGTLGFLLRLKKKGIIKKVEPFINKLLENKIWLSSDVIELTLEKANER